MKAGGEPQDLSGLTRAVEKARRAQRDVHDQMYRAHRAGASYRRIAIETGLSHENVRQIVKATEAWIAKEKQILDTGPIGHTVDAITRSEKERAKRRARLDYLRGVENEHTAP